MQTICLFQRSELRSPLISWFFIFFFSEYYLDCSMKGVLEDMETIGRSHSLVIKIIPVTEQGARVEMESLRKNFTQKYLSCVLKDE